MARIKTAFTEYNKTADNRPASPVCGRRNNNARASGARFSVCKNNESRSGEKIRFTVALLCSECHFSCDADLPGHIRRRRIAGMHDIRTWLGHDIMDTYDIPPCIGRRKAFGRKEKEGYTYKSRNSRFYNILYSQDARI